MTNIEDRHSWLFGLERFFEFRGDLNSKNLIRCLINILYTSDKDKAWALKSCITLDYDNFIAEGREHRVNVYADVMSNQALSHTTLFWLLHSINNASFIQNLYLFFNNADTVVVNDLFSKSQVLSKIWMAETLSKIPSNLGNIIILGGWYGQHKWYIDSFKFKKIYNVDIDGTVLEQSKNIMGSPDTYEVILEDANRLIRADGQIVINNEIIDAGIIINTSAEHMTTEWFDRLPLGQTVLLQSNNMFGMTGHINCVNTLEELKHKFPMRHQHFAGELTLNKGTRFMIYGIK